MTSDTTLERGFEFDFPEESIFQFNLKLREKRFKQYNYLQSNT